MRIRKWLMLVSSITILGLLVSCAPAAAPTPSKAATTPPEATPTSVGVKPAAGASAAARTAPAATPKPAAAEPKSGGILNVAHFGDPIMYDPIQDATFVSMALVVPNYSGIVQHDPLEPTKIIGDLAERWEVSPDGLTYTFRFFKNVKWQDSVPFTAEDARFTLETTRKPPRGIVSPKAEFFKAVDKVEASNGDTLKVTLQYPSASFLDNLGDGRMVVVPKHVFEAKGNLKKDIVGTGPYKFKSFAAGTSFSVVKDPDYFAKGRPYLDGITWYVITDVATRFAALRTHRVQVSPLGSGGLTPTQTELIRKEMSDKITLQRYPGLIFHAFWMPLTKTPWSDIRVRRAVELTIDRPKVIKVAVEGVGDVGGFMAPGNWGLPQEELLKMPGYRQNKDADIAEAKKLMADAGYAQGIKATAIVRNVQLHERGAVGLKEQLAQIGIDVSISLKDTGTMLDLLAKHTYDTAVFSGTSSYDDPDQVLGQHFVTGVMRNYTEFSDQKIDEWYDEQARTMDGAKRKQIVLDMQRRLFDLLPASILYWSVYELGHWNQVRGYGTGIGLYNNLKFQNVWLAQ